MIRPNHAPRSQHSPLFRRIRFALVKHPDPVGRALVLATPWLHLWVYVARPGMLPALDEYDWLPQPSFAVPSARDV